MVGLTLKLITFYSFIKVNGRFIVMPFLLLMKKTANVYDLCN